MHNQRVYAGFSTPGAEAPSKEDNENGGMHHEMAASPQLMYRGVPMTGVRRPRAELSSSDKKEFTKNSPDKLRFYSSACCLPNPLKKTEGEDAFMITPCGTALAVADGVGGWAEVGIDSGEYSREMCRNAARFVRNRGESNPRAILRYAFDNSKSQGTSTCCILTISDNILCAANLGDSGFIVLRQTEHGLRFIMQSEEQQYDFNTPRQLGTNSLDMPHDAHRYELQMHSGDIVIAGTDGLFDNLSVEDIMNELDRHITHLHSKGCELSSDEETLAKLASHIATTAYLVSKDPTVTTPFSLSAAKHNILHCGGKMDDITIVVAVVGPENMVSDRAAGDKSSKANNNPADVFFLPPAAFSMDEDEIDDSKVRATTQSNQSQSGTGNSPDTVYTNYSMDDHREYMNDMIDEDF